MQENYLTLCFFLGLLSKEIWDFFGCFGVEEAQLGEAVKLINFQGSGFVQSIMLHKYAYTLISQESMWLNMESY